MSKNYKKKKKKKKKKEENTWKRLIFFQILGDYHLIIIQNRHSKVFYWR